MKKNITLAFWSGGGVWGQSQLINAKHIVDRTQIHLADIVDIHAAGSIGNIPALVTATKNPYQTALENFQKCATDMMGGTLRQDQLKKSVIHSLRNMEECSWYNPKRFVLKDHTNQIHLNHDILQRFLTSSLGETKLEELQSAFVSFAHHQESNDRICFAHSGNSGLFDGSKWAVIPNHGADKTLVDIAMASTAAPTVFGPHEIDGDHYIDCAALCSPLATIKNVFRMVADPQNTKVNVLFFGTGLIQNDSWDAQAYKNHGILQIIQDWSSSMGYGNVKQDFREIQIDYADRVSMHMINTPIPQTHNGTEFKADAFNGTTAYLKAIEEITEQHLETSGRVYCDAIEKIAEQQERETAIDPLVIAQQPRNLLNRFLKRAPANA